MLQFTHLDSGSFTGAIQPGYTIDQLADAAAQSFRWLDSAANAIAQYAASEPRAPRPAPSGKAACHRHLFK